MNRVKKSNFLSLFFTLFTFVVFSGFGMCGGVNGLGGGSDSGESGGAAGTGGGSGNVLPVGSLPPPALVGGAIVAYNTDTQNIDPIVGFEDALDVTGLSDADGDGFIDDYKVVVSDAAQTSASDICDKTGVTCWAITTSGSFEAYPPSASSHYLYVTDGQSLSSAVNKTPNSHLLWTAQAPDDLAVTGSGLDLAALGVSDAGVVFALAGGGVVPMMNDGGSFKVVGDYTTGYSVGSVSGTQLAFDPNNFYLADRRSTGIPYSTFGASYLGDPTATVLSALGVAEVEEAEDYTVLKRTGTDNKIRFAIKPVSTTQNEGKIYDLTDPLSSPTIFLESGDKDSGGTVMTNKQTLAFDVDDGTLEVSIALFEDLSDQVRLRSVYPISSTRFGGTSPLSSGDGFTFTAEDFGDLLIYLAQPNSTTVGRALLLDKTHSLVWMLSYFYNVSHPTSSTLTSSLTEATDGITLSAHPKDMVLNGDKTKAYVLGDDDKIYILDLFTSDGLTAYEAPSVSVNTIALTDYVDVSTDLSPETLSYQQDSSGNGYLLVGLQGIKGVLAVDLANAQTTKIK